MSKLVINSLQEADLALFSAFDRLGRATVLTAAAKADRETAGHALRFVYENGTRADLTQRILTLASHVRDEQRADNEYIGKPTDHYMRRTFRTVLKRLNDLKALKDSGEQDGLWFNGERFKITVTIPEGEGREIQHEWVKQDPPSPEQTVVMDAVQAQVHAAALLRDAMAECAPGDIAAQFIGWLDAADDLLLQSVQNRLTAVRKERQAKPKGKPATPAKSA